MMKSNQVKRFSLFAIVLLFICVKAFSQEKADSNLVRLDSTPKLKIDKKAIPQIKVNPNLEPQPLDTLKFINNKQLTSQYNVILNTNDPNSFIVKDKVDSTNSMIKKVNQNRWIVYKLPVFDGFINPTYISPNPDPKLQGEFATYTNYLASGQSGVIASEKDAFIIDIKRHTYLQLTAFSHYETYAQQPKQRKGETYTHYEKRLSELQNPYTERSTDIHLNGGYLTLKILFEENGVKYRPPFRSSVCDDTSSGVYKYINGVFVKIKTYKQGFKGLQPISH